MPCSGKNRSEFMTELQRSGREALGRSTIEKRDIKKMVRSLRNNRAVWYAPDQSYNRKGSEVYRVLRSARDAHNGDVDARAPGRRAGRSVLSAAARRRDV